MNDVHTLAVEAMRAKGAADAQELRGRAAELDGTALIAEEEKIPRFDPEKDYSGWTAGAPVWEEVDGTAQVYRLITPHNAAHYPGASPFTLPALWSVCHTREPALAKPWLAPSGTSGLYAAGECCVQDGRVWRCLQDGCAFSPSALPEQWEELCAAGGTQGGDPE